MIRNADILSAVYGCTLHCGQNVRVTFLYCTRKECMHEPYYRRLPHILPPGETLFITYRLYGTLSFDVLRRLREEHALFVQQATAENETLDAARKRLEGRYFVSFDHYLDRCMGGENWLQQAPIAELVRDSLLHGRDTLYDLHAFCIMPNHVHVLLTIMREDIPFYKVLQRMKTYTAVRANRILNRVGKSFWQPESYDHLVRHKDSFERIIRYILQNPVKAGLVDNWEDWPYSFYKYM